MNIEEKILTKLVTKYRNSRKDLGTNTILRATRIRPSEIYRRYASNDGDYTAIEEVNATAKALCDKGYIKVVKEPFGTQIEEMILSDGKVEEIEGYLAKHYGYVSKDSIIDAMQKLIKTYENKSPHCNSICTQLKELAAKRKVVRNIQDTEDTLIALAFIENNNEDLYIREASMKIFGDSKYLESTVLQMVCHHLRNGEPTAEGEMEDEILGQYHIHKEPRNITLKGTCTITVNGKPIDISAFQNGITFSATDLTAITSINLYGQTFMTIENKTAWMRFDTKNAVTMYLGGYADRFQRDFIRKVYEDNKDSTFLHFGDIDPGGFWIHHHLVTSTNVPFGLFEMSIATLQNKKYESCLHKLTDNDITRLQQLKNKEPYQEVVHYMLKNNVKLEQEIVALDVAMQN